jgi:hypothetical protein
MAVNLPSWVEKFCGDGWTGGEEYQQSTSRPRLCSLLSDKTSLAIQLAAADWLVLARDFVSFWPISSRRFSTTAGTQLLVFTE